MQRKRLKFSLGCLLTRRHFCSSVFACASARNKDREKLLHETAAHQGTRASALALFLSSLFGFSVRHAQFFFSSLSSLILACEGRII